MNIRNSVNTLKNRFLRSVYRHDPHGRGITGKVIAVLLIFDFILFVIVVYTEVIVRESEWHFSSLLEFKRRK